MHEMHADIGYWHVLNLIHTSAIWNSFHTVQRNYFNYKQTATRMGLLRGNKKKYRSHIVVVMAICKRLHVHIFCLQIQRNNS